MLQARVCSFYSNRVATPSFAVCKKDLFSSEFYVISRQTVSYVKKAVLQLLLTVKYAVQHTTILVK